jgi:hypothetical protein
MEYINNYGMTYDTLVTDRHTSISKHMKEKLQEVNHYFDLWHLRKSMMYHVLLYEYRDLSYEYRDLRAIKR